MMAVCHRESALPAFRRQTSLIVSHQPSPSKMMNLKGVFITNNLSVLKLLDVGGQDVNNFIWMGSVIVLPIQRTYPHHPLPLTPYPLHLFLS